MNSKSYASIFTGVMLARCVLPAVAQGSFQNLDFENGTFVPIPGDPFGSVEWASAVPGWTGYLGATPADRLLYDNLFLSNAGIAIFDNAFMSGQNYMVLQNSFPTPTVTPAIAQTGTIPSGAQSLTFYSISPFVLTISASFDGNQIPLVHLGTVGNNLHVWGGDISQFANQTGELRFSGAGYLDNIQFSSTGIPEPSTFTLFGLGLAALWWRRRSVHGV